MGEKSNPKPIVIAKKEDKHVKDVELIHALNPKEKELLATLEGIIEKGLKGFMETGRALFQIKKDNLYRETHSNFEDYCREKWGMGRNYADKQISAYSAVSNLGTIVPLPINEAQVRPLTWLDTPADQKKAWRKVVKIASNGTITAFDVTQVVNEMRGKNDGGKSSAAPNMHNIYLALQDFDSALRAIIRKHRKKLDADMDVTDIEKVLDKTRDEIESLIEKAVNPIKPVLETVDPSASPEKGPEVSAS